jgi:16S rRNA (uracil1498-N3)-methyltransferase
LTPRLLVRNAGEALGGEDEPTLIRLPREQAHYLTRVLRLTEGSALEVFDGAGARYLARLAQAGGEGCRISIETALPPSAPPTRSITLAQCLSSADKMDWTIEKAVELGARRIIPLFSERSPVRFDAQRAARKREHWQAIIEAACMQCGEDQLPELLEPSGLGQWLSGTSSLDALRLVLSPTGSLSLVECVSTSDCADPPAGTGFPAQGPRPIELLVGPESGLSETEVALATRAGWQPVRLGPRVLRTETAGLAALAAIAAIAGDFR